MAWTKPQRGCFMRAAAIAGWADPQRYIVMRHCGCPLDAKTRKPSVSHQRNDDRMFERCMAVAERHAAGNGAAIDPPRGGNGRTWSDCAARSNARMVEKIEAIADELVRRVASKFEPGFLAGYIERMTRHDAGVTLAPPPRSLDACDEGQLYRILEGLKAWGGREMLDRGITPTTFIIPANARAQHTRKHAAA
jgi:hypothetical protein